MKILGWPIALVLVAMVTSGSLYAAYSYRCKPMNCGTSTCTWWDRTWPAENVCVYTEMENPEECQPEPGYGWDCTDTTTDRRCGKVYWNYIGQLGGASNCTTSEGGIGASCGQSNYQWSTGDIVPDDCQETSP